MKEILNRFLTVKSVITIIFSVVFSVLSLTGKISSEQFLMIFTTVIAFYFGTQHDKNKGK